MPNGSELAPIQTQPPPYAIPEVLREGVMTVFTSLPFQSTSHAASSASGNTGRLYVFEFDAVIFCWPIHKPPGASVITASALGYMPGDLNNLVVLATRAGTRPLPPAPPPRAPLSGAVPPCSASVITEPMFHARPAARNSLRFMLMASPLKGVEIPCDVVRLESRRTLYHTTRRDAVVMRLGEGPRLATARRGRSV